MHSCVDCGAQAQEWSYTGDRTSSYSYSRNPMDYVPRCRTCHGVFDARPTVAINPDVGAAIATARRKLGITQAELARRLGLKHCQISHVENGRRRLGSEHLQEATAILKMTPGDLRYAE